MTMVVFHKIKDVRAYIHKKKDEKKTLGLVPTMGAIHEGHISLIFQSKRECDLTIATIFVNPSQFNDANDLENYPRTFEKDKVQLMQAGCDILFAPEVDEVYPNTTDDGLKMNFGFLETVMEGVHRSGHFAGVGLIVSKLFNIIEPNYAYFGQKDLQQVAIIKKLVSNLNFPILIRVGKTLREPSGLAMSSRNSRLSMVGLETAKHISLSLKLVKKSVERGESINSAKSIAKDYLSNIDSLALEYLEIVDSNSMQNISTIGEHRNVSVCVAACIEGVRLIDNLYLKNDH